MRNPGRSAAIGAAVALTLITISAIVIALESRYRSCVSAAQARYPAVAVSAFNTRTTGPLKVSFVEQRQSAVDDCGRL